MGGKAFGKRYNTPRISANHYVRLREKYLQRLQAYFTEVKVSVLLEAPGKTSYGDIDYIVATDHATVDLNQMMNAVGAVDIIIFSPHMCSMVVRKNDSSTNDQTSIQPADPDNPKHNNEDALDIEEEFFQVDVEIVPPYLFEWHSIYSSYGDLNLLIGRIIKQLGFTFRHTGFFLKMKELDDSKFQSHQNISDEDGGVFLSRDPDQVMRFLGLSTESYHGGFDTIEQFYEWLASCKLLSLNSIPTRRPTSHQRTRETFRPLYTNFFNEWLLRYFFASEPSCPQSIGEKFDQEITDQKRAEYLIQALDFFDKTEEYERKHAIVKRSIANSNAAHLVRPVLEEYSGKKDKNLTQLVRAFRRYTGVSGDGVPYALEESRSDSDTEIFRLLGDDGESLRDPDIVRAWIRDHWQGIRSLERQQRQPS